MTNSSPKNFRSMTFPSARDGTRTAVYAPLPPAPPPRTITAVDLEKRAKQLKEMKSFVNAERCPLCSSQLDGLIAYDGATVYCVTCTEQNYRAHYKFGNNIPTWSSCVYYTTYFAYNVINSCIEDSLYKVQIFKIDLSLNKKFQQLNKKEILNYEGERLHLNPNQNEEEFLNKIKLYTLFG